MGGESIRWAPGSPPLRLRQPLLPRLNCPDQGAVSFDNSCGIAQVACDCSNITDERCWSGCRKPFAVRRSAASRLLQIMECPHPQDT